MPPEADTAGTGRQDPVPALVDDHCECWYNQGIACCWCGDDSEGEGTDAYCPTPQSSCKSTPIDYQAAVVAAARAETAAERRLDAIGSALTRRTDDWRHGDHALAVAAVRAARLARSAAVRALEDGERHA